jgi:hypothetical protein
MLDVYYKLEYQDDNVIMYLSEYVDATYEEFDELAESLHLEDPVLILMPYPYSFDFYHITKSDSVQDILRNGLEAGSNSGSFGKGIYLFDPYSQDAWDNINDLFNEVCSDRLRVITGSIPEDTDNLYYCVYGDNHAGYVFYKEDNLPPRWIYNAIEFQDA